MNASMISNSAAEEQFGRRLAARLTSGTVELPHDSTERLRAARVQALARRKVQVLQAAPVVISNGGAAVMGGGWWTRIATIAPLIALVVGLVTVSILQEDHRANELADVDSALLTDELPPAAYTDPGFLQFLKADEAPAR